ncbi:MAG: 2-oxo-4-hydroxy-4-carboxy-5-ureidoimidazoline decarboxylase [Gammaproteobacteria bacterium]|nr:2-oxo-4-hydroxy-4-carboxy-5-ureidoimidazoline decarboxylase [Gammaproteobacteria bacterium]
MKDAFVARYGGIYEHSPWVAEKIYDVLGEQQVDVGRLAEMMADCVDNASREDQLALICAHPDLAGKAQVAGELTAESTTEQASAGLDQCTSQEFERFQSLNAAYKQKFGFPFVMAVRDSDRSQILQAFGVRLLNDYDAEFEAALQEIHRIASLRLTALQDQP